MESTLKAMKKVSEIQSKRQGLFFKMRMKAVKAINREAMKADIKNGIELIAPAAANREVAIANAVKKVSVRSKVTEDKMEN
jgi:hypothetical protein